MTVTIYETQTNNIFLYYEYNNSFKFNSNLPSTSPSILVENENLITDPVLVANCLQDHFKSVFSEPNNQLDPLQNMTTPNVTFPLSDLNLTTTDIENAIQEIKSSSACPNSEIPAKMLKQFKSALSYPLMLFWNKSFNAGVVPISYKLQQIIPIHKKGSKTNAKNFRPIFLTSHIINRVE